MMIDDETLYVSKAGYVERKDTQVTNYTSYIKYFCREVKYNYTKRPWS
jgi:hypothetical protein